MSELVLLFAGPMGAGKTTAIQSLSEIDVVRTEAVNTDRETADKATTTVALDYGEITLNDDAKVRLYGVPGQKRFSFMWQILKERAVGMVLLVNNDAKQPVESMLQFLDDFENMSARGAVVIGITRSDVAPHPRLDDYAAALAIARPGLQIPVVPVDARDRGDVSLMLMSLVVNLESGAPVLPVEAAA